MIAYGKVNLTSAVDWSHPLNKGRLGWWYIPTASGWAGGNQVRDLCRRADGTITTGASFIPYFDSFPNGMRCLRWDNGGSIDGQIDIGGATLFDLTDNFTVGCTFITETLTPTGLGALAGLLSKYNSPGANSWTFRQHNATLEFGGSTLLATGSVLALSTVYRAVAVMNAGTATIYLNGQSSATGAVAISSSADTVYIGEAYEPGGANFKGRIGDAFIANRPWSSAEVMADYRYSSVGYKCYGSPLRFVNLPLFRDSLADYTTLGTMDTDSGGMRYVGPAYLGTTNTAVVSASGIGPIGPNGGATLGTTDQATGGMFGSVPTLVVLGNTDVTAGGMTAGGPVTLGTLDNAIGGLIGIVNGDSKILRQRLYRR